MTWRAPTSAAPSPRSGSPAAGLCSVGWEVTACERAAALEPVGAGLSLGPNGLRALDVVGAGDALRALAVPQELGIRRSDGRWLMRSTTGRMVTDRFGDSVILVPRAAVIDALAARVPDGVLSLGTEVTSVHPGGGAAVLVSSTAGELEADLVVAADGIRSAIRTVLFPGHPGLRYAGFTTWQLLAGPVSGPVPMAESWGRGAVFGVMPLSDGRVYCYAAAPAASGARAGDELAELARLFGIWHEPIPALLAAARPQDVIRRDVAELAAPLPSFHRSRTVLLGDAAHPMTPNLGQGACQALEDAAVLARLAAGTEPDAVPAMLAAYTAARLPRTTDVVRWSRRAAAMATRTSPPAVGLRNTLTRLAGKLAPGAVRRWEGHFRHGFRLRRTGPRADFTARYPASGHLLTRRLNEELITGMWDDLLRVAASVKGGHASGALVVGKLCSSRRQQNALASAIKEYGALRRTVYAARYLVDETYRRRIGRQLNKGENVHSLKRMRAYAGEGAIRRPHHEQQAEQMWCLTLAAIDVL